MMDPRKFSCPDCGSEAAVGKEFAWDALCEVPPKVQAELDRLRLIESAANQIIARRGEPGSPNVVVQTVPIDILDRLQDAFRGET